MLKLKRIHLITLLLFVVSFIAYFQTLWMYFWIDDNALIYKLQHINTYSGYWGKGIFGEGPYRHIIDQFVPFYPLFKINPTPYFAVGIILYFLAALTVYFFISLVSKNRILAAIGGIIFASGYVGSESLFGITNSWQTSRGIITALLTFMSFYKFIKTRNSLFYLFSIVLFFFSLDTAYVRAHGLIFSIFFFDLLFWPAVYSKKFFVGLFIRQLPFFVIHYYVYLSSLGYAKRFEILHLLQEIIIEGKYYLIFIPMQNVGNLFIPDKITLILDQLVSQYIHIPSAFSTTAAFSGILFIILLLTIILKFRKKENFLVRLAIFSAVWIIGNIVVFFLRETSLILQTTHRYLTYSFVGLSIFWALIILLLTRNLEHYKKLVVISLTTFIVAIYLALGLSYQYSFNERRSIPARKFFSDFQRAIPNIPKGAVIFFDVANSQKVKNEYNSFFGGMFSEAGNLAILGYVEDYTSDFLVTYDFNELMKLLKEDKTNLDKVYSFYYGEDRLVDTSSQVRELLVQGKTLPISASNFSSNTPFTTFGNTLTTETLFNESNGKTSGESPVITIVPPEDTSSLVPVRLAFSMRVSPKNPLLPYKSGEQIFQIDKEKKVRIFSYLSSQGNFRKNAVVTSASFWKEQKPKLAFDGRLETAWRGHRGYWDDIARGNTNNIEYFNVDFKKVLTVSQIMWVSAQRPLVPTHYRILASLDGKLWELVKEVTGGTTLPEGTVVIDSFPPKTARFVKMEILKTYGNDGPELKEFEVIESKFADLDKGLVEHVKNKPFASIETEDEYFDALEFIKKNAKVRFWWMSDAESSQDPNKYIDMSLMVDGEFHEYKIDLPASGQYWTRFSLEGFNFPSEIIISEIKLIYQSIEN